MYQSTIPLCLALVASYIQKPIPSNQIHLGEIDLCRNVRDVPDALLFDLIEDISSSQIATPFTVALPTKRSVAVAAYSSMKAALQDPIHNAIETIYIDDYPRGGRDTLEWLPLVAMVERFGRKRVIGVSDGFDLSSPMGRLQLHMYGAFCEYFIEQLREKVYRGAKAAAARGSLLGNPPLGYKAVPLIDENGRPVTGRSGRHLKHLAVDEHSIKYVMMAFEMFTAGSSYYEITMKFNELAVAGRRSWVDESLKQVLQRRIYIGVKVYNQKNYRLDRETPVPHQRGRGRRPPCSTSVFPPPAEGRPR